MRSSYSGSVMGPNTSSWTLPRMFMPAPWMTRTLGIFTLPGGVEWRPFYSGRTDRIRLTPPRLQQPFEPVPPLHGLPRWSRLEDREARGEDALDLGPRHGEG